MNGGYIRRLPSQLSEKFGYGWWLNMSDALARMNSPRNSACAGFRPNHGIAGCQVAILGGVNVRAALHNSRVKYAHGVPSTRKNDALMPAAHRRRSAL
jgi:hypothetical protein